MTHHLQLPLPPCHPLPPNDTWWHPMTHDDTQWHIEMVTKNCWPKTDQKLLTKNWPTTIDQNMLTKTCWPKTDKQLLTKNCRPKNCRPKTDQQHWHIHLPTWHITNHTRQTPHTSTQPNGTLTWPRSLHKMTPNDTWWHPMTHRNSYLAWSPLLVNIVVHQELLEFLSSSHATLRGRTAHSHGQKLHSTLLQPHT